MEVKLQFQHYPVHGESQVAQQLPKPTTELLHIFTKRVEVSKYAKKRSYTALKKVFIYYRDIGLADEPPENVADYLKKQN